MPWLARLAVAWAINAAALWAADALWGSVRIHGWAAYLIGSAVLGIANTVLKPVLALLTLPLIIVTLGFAYLAINIAMVALAEWIAPNFSIDGFWTYVGVVVVVWAVNWIGREVVDRVEEGSRAEQHVVCAGVESRGDREAGAAVLDEVEVGARSEVANVRGLALGGEDRQPVAGVEGAEDLAHVILQTSHLGVTEGK